VESARAVGVAKPGGSGPCAKNAKGWGTRRGLPPRSPKARGAPSAWFGSVIETGATSRVEVHRLPHLKIEMWATRPPTSDYIWSLNIRVRPLPCIPDNK
jgi:hypothetical protein